MERAKAPMDEEGVYETARKWYRVQLRAISRFMDTGDAGELEWVVENTKCRMCRIHARTALVLHREGHEELAMRNLEFAIEALKGMLEEAEKGVEDAAEPNRKEKA